MQAPEQPEEDLAQLGIMEIKPVGGRWALSTEVMMTTTHPDHPDKVVMESFFADAPGTIRSANPQQGRLEKKRLVRELWYRKPRRNRTPMC